MKRWFELLVQTDMQVVSLQKIKDSSLFAVLRLSSERRVGRIETVVNLPDIVARQGARLEFSRFDIVRKKAVKFVDGKKNFLYEDNYGA